MQLRECYGNEIIVWVGFLVKVLIKSDDVKFGSLITARQLGMFAGVSLFTCMAYFFTPAELTWAREA